MFSLIQLNYFLLEQNLKPPLKDLILFLEKNKLPQKNSLEERNVKTDHESEEQSWQPISDR